MASLGHNELIYALFFIVRQIGYAATAAVAIITAAADHHCNKPCPITWTPDILP